MNQLSKRLAAIAAQVKLGSRLADIGSDHALLPAHLALSGKIARGIAGELNKGPLEAAKRQIAAAGLGSVVEARLGNGLDVLEPGEADTVTIAGMGGALIAEILEAGRVKGKLGGVRHLILQPNVGEQMVRSWLRRNGWLLVGEEILEEDGKIYEILSAYPAAEAEGGAAAEAELYRERELAGFGAVSEADWLVFGPYLLKRAEPAFVEKWRRESAKLERVAQSMESSELEESRQKRLKVLEEMKRLKELMACLQKDKPLFN
ncbi:MAG: tRNA ((1))-methyltransferase [Paenibacillaceae bacterium]|jgi:tRNA (adenine22-N1)-methyltransferase|nr:tRNA ((1))-methyltransferase [Paenibacillaceae bacterium]